MILTYLVVSDHEGQDFSSVAGEISSWFTCLFFTRPTLDRFRSELDLVVNTVARLSFGQRIFHVRCDVVSSTMELRNIPSTMHRGRGMH